MCIASCPERKALLGSRVPRGALHSLIHRMALKQASPTFHFRGGKTRLKGDLAFVNSTPPPIPSFYSETFKEECGLPIKRHDIRLSQENSSTVFKVNLGNLRPYLRKKKNQ